MAKFKVRRDALFMGAACFVDGAVDIDDGLNTASGSVSTFSGGLTAASSFLVSGSARIGSAGTDIAGILVGSATLVFGNLNSGATSSTSVTVTGLTQAHKVFLSASDVDPALAFASIGCSPGGGVIKVGVTNIASTQYSSGTEYIAYLAILDK